MSKLSYEDKISLYNDKQKGMSINALVSKYGIRHEGMEYSKKLRAVVQARKNQQQKKK